jgi:hypothetical protein
LQKIAIRTEKEEKGCKQRKGRKPECKG